MKAFVAFIHIDVDALSRVHYEQLTHLAGQVGIECLRYKVGRQEYALRKKQKR